MSCEEWKRLAAAAEVAGIRAGFTARTGSTNDDVMARLAAGEPPPFLLVAEEQDKGRGRMGRQWFSPPGCGLYFTVALAAGEPGLVPFASLAAGTACATAVRRLTAAEVMLKWPNDLFLGGRKLGGILCETPPSAPGRTKAIAVGVGMNVNAGAAPPAAIRNRMVSLEEILGRKVCRAALLTAMIREIRTAVEELWRAGKEAVIARWQELDWTRGRELEWVSLSGERVSGTGCGLDPGGRLLVRGRDGRIHAVLSGDITVS